MALPPGPRLPTIASRLDAGRSERGADVSDIQIIQGDCREIIQGLQEPIDFVVSDPPYGIDYVHGGGGRSPQGDFNPVRHYDPIAGDDESFDPTFLLRWPCVLFGADHYCNRLPAGGSFHAWDKITTSTLDDSFSDAEFIWTSWKCKARIIKHLWKGILRDGKEKGVRKVHVSQKPVAVMVQLLEWFTKPGDTVLDPFAGSGSTLVACLKTGRRGIGIEIDPRYIPTIERRVAEARTPLFDAIA